MKGAISRPGFYFFSRIHEAVLKVDPLKKVFACLTRPTSTRRGQTGETWARSEAEATDSSLDFVRKVVYEWLLRLCGPRRGGGCLQKNAFAAFFRFDNR